MVADIRVRKLEDWVVAVHRRLASAEGESLENHFRQLLMESALESQNKFADRAEVTLTKLQEKHGLLPDSADVNRDERWNRG